MDRSPATSTGNIDRGRMRCGLPWSDARIGTWVEIERLTHVRSGKVREIYDAGDGRLALVATDRVSTYDCVHPTPIPDKGRVLTGLSAFWFDRTADIVDNHLLSASVQDLPEAARSEELRGRVMLVRRTEVVPFECVARGYLTGSGLKEYAATGRVCGIPLPQGLGEASELPEPIFTPATKAESGHDENVPFETMSGSIGSSLAQRLRELTIALYEHGRDHALSRGIILADTKFEFGIAGGEIILIDEVMTPDSSRYWPAETYVPGQVQPSFDKQFVRDYATSTGWDRSPPAPELPDDVVQRTRAKYVEAYERLTESSFEAWLSRP